MICFDSLESLRGEMSHMVSEVLESRLNAADSAPCGTDACVFCPAGS